MICRQPGYSLSAFYSTLFPVKSSKLAIQHFDFWYILLINTEYFNYATEIRTTSLKTPTWSQLKIPEAFSLF